MREPDSVTNSAFLHEIEELLANVTKNVVQNDILELISNSLGSIDDEWLEWEHTRKSYWCFYDHVMSLKYMLCCQSKPENVRYSRGPAFPSAVKKYLELLTTDLKSFRNRQCWHKMDTASTRLKMTFTKSDAILKLHEGKEQAVVEWEVMKHTHWIHHWNTIKNDSVVLICLGRLTTERTT